MSEYLLDLPVSMELLLYNTRKGKPRIRVTYKGSHYYLTREDPAFGNFAMGAGHIAMVARVMESQVFACPCGGLFRMDEANDQVFHAEPVCDAYANSGSFINFMAWVMDNGGLKPGEDG